MALQHFYSRVPARLSLFNHMDSFDTFACSKGLEREFIEKELSALYDNKPSKDDALLIKNDQLAPIYCHYFTKDGKLLQGKITYYSLDYTGEKSTYLVHSLIPDNYEKESILKGINTPIFSGSNFSTTINDFDLLSQKGSAITNYPELKYKIDDPIETSWITNEFESDIVKKLIFCILDICCGKGKNIFISLTNNLYEQSEKALNFMNSILQILPFSLRKYISFATYTDDANRFTDYKIRFIPSEIKPIPSAKGVTLHLESSISLGLNEQVVSSARILVDFFYYLLKNDEVRKSFLLYMDDISNKNPDKKLNLKTLTELVFLFEECSGYFKDKSIIPDDTMMYEYFCAYDKHRELLPSSFRTVAMKCLTRYSENKTAIPKDVFSKMCKMYPTEPTDSKKNIMDVVLSLIHTDAMRDKLFSFINNNFDDESESTKSIICNDLSRVYYGGFLQNQILTFYEEHYFAQSPSVKNEIFDKLLLTIRTENVKDKIISFIDKIFDELVSTQKAKFFNVFFDMIPFCDQLSIKLIKIVDKHVDSLSDTEETLIQDKLYSIASNVLGKKELNFYTTIFSTDGICKQLFLEKVFDNCSTELFRTFISEFCKLSLNDSIKTITFIFDNIKNITLDVSELLAISIVQILRSESYEANADLYSYIEANKTLNNRIDRSKAELKFDKIFLDNYINYHIKSKMLDAFSIKKKRTGLEDVRDFVNQEGSIAISKEYEPVNNYYTYIQSAKSNQCDQLLILIDLLDIKEIKDGLAEHLRLDLIENGALIGDDDSLSKFITVLFIEYLKNRKIDLSMAYNDDINCKVNKIIKSKPKTKREVAESEAAEAKIKDLLYVANKIYSSDYFKELKDKFFNQQESMGKALTIYCSKVSKCSKTIEEVLNSESYNNDFKNKILAFAQEYEKANSFFGKLFSKKK